MVLSVSICVCYHHILCNYTGCRTCHFSKASKKEDSFILKAGSGPNHLLWSMKADMVFKGGGSLGDIEVCSTTHKRCLLSNQKAINRNTLVAFKLRMIEINTACWNFYESDADVVHNYYALYILGIILQQKAISDVERAILQFSKGENTKINQHTAQD